MKMTARFYLMCGALIIPILLHASHKKNPRISLKDLDAVALHPQHEHVYVNDDTKSHLLKIQETFPHHAWSEEYKSVCRGLTDDKVIVYKESAERCVNECLHVLESSHEPYQESTDTLRYYQEALIKGDSSLFVKIDKHSHKGRKRTVFCNLLVKDCLTVEGGLEVLGHTCLTGELLTNNIVASHIIITGNNSNPDPNCAATVAFVKKYVANNGGGGNITVNNLGDGEGIYKPLNPSADTTINLKSLGVDESTGLAIGTDTNDNTIIISTNATPGNSPEARPENNRDRLVQRDSQGNFAANMITLGQDPTLPLEVATKQYVDNKPSGNGMPITVQNVGTSGAEIYKNEDPSHTFNFKKLIADNGVIIDDTSDTDTLTIKTNGTADAIAETLVMRDSNSHFSTKSMNLSDQAASHITLNNERLLRFRPNQSNEPVSMYLGYQAGPILLSGGLFGNVGETGIGIKALSASQGSSNTAVGRNALGDNTSGGGNTGIGDFALTSNKEGRGNTGIGAGTLLFPHTANANKNTALGHFAGGALREGNNNIYIGTNVGNGDSLFSQSNTIRIGHPNAFTERNDPTDAHTACYIGGIKNHSLTNGNPATVGIDTTTGRLGVLTLPSRNDIIANKALGINAHDIMKLKPAVYIHKNRWANKPSHVGLILEDVQETVPSLLSYDENNNPIAFKYDMLTVLLLKQVQVLKEKMAKQDRIIDKLQQ